MVKVQLNRLTPRDYFRFGESSSEYFVISHFRYRANTPVTKIANCKTYKTTIVSSYVWVFLPPYEFTKQLTLF